MLRLVSTRNFSSLVDLSAVLQAQSWSALQTAIAQSQAALAQLDQGASTQCEKGFIYSKVRDEEVDAALDELADIVVNREPLAIATQFNYKEYRQVICEKFLKPSEFSKFSIRVTRDDKPAGMFIALDWKKQRRIPPENTEEEATWEKLEPIALFLNRNNLIQVVKEGMACHDIVGGVFPQYENQGVATKSLALKIALACYHGFDYFIAESGFGCSNASRVYAKFLEFGSEMKFADFVYKGEKVFAHLTGGYVLLIRELKLEI